MGNHDTMKKTGISIQRLKINLEIQLRRNDLIGRRHHAVLSLEGDHRAAVVDGLLGVLN